MTNTIKLLTRLFNTVHPEPVERLSPNGIRAVLPAGVVIGTLMTLTPLAANAFVIDDFSAPQSVTDRGNLPGATSNTLGNLAGTQLGQATRVVNAETFGSGLAYKTKVQIGNNSLRISNNDGASGLATLDWHFDAIDFSYWGNSLSLNVTGIENRPLDPSVTAHMIINGLSSSGIRNVTQTGDLLFKFSEFSVSTVMSSVQSLRLIFSGPDGWDAQFGALALTRLDSQTSAPVPVPASIYTMTTVLLGYVGLSRHRRRSLNAYA